MALAPKLQMRQGQSLVMTPQLQQAIKLLQLSNIELAEYVETELEKNPLLQRGEAGETVAADRDAPETSSQSELKLDDAGAVGAAQGDLDAPREDVYEADSPSERVSDAPANPSNDAAGGPSSSLDWSNASSGRGGGEDFDFESVTAESLSLKDHLHEQLSVAALSPAARLIALRLIDETDDAGYMRGDLDALATALGASEGEIEDVLHICQGFEPTGVMARSVQECLVLQLKEMNRFDPAMEALIDNLDLLAKHDLKRLVEICGVDQDDLADMISEVKSLTPRPGAAYSGESAPTVAPDVFVRELPNGMYSVELNTETLPRVLIDRSYYAEVSAVARTEDEKTFVTDCHANASWLIKSLDQRARTILKVAREIVRQQDGFFAEGVQSLRPLNLKTVADAVEMHESTVSRVTSNKFMATPRGMFELKYFFSAAIPATSGGEAHSAEAVRYRIKSLVDAEACDAVLSDDQIVERLRAFGVDIARRTVAKYRESLRIPSSVERRRILARSA
ncbi:MAG: RNA polymerase factor sigma-54 [Pseudomonadota bacterium]